MLEVRHILALRFSAMGDVAMAVPVVKAVLQTHPQLHITVVSTESHRNFFQDIESCSFVAVSTKDAHKGFLGMFKLYKQLSKLQRFDAVADLHDVLRTKILRLFFTVSSSRIAVIDKGRAAKKALTSKDHKILRQLPTSHERYAKVFASLGFPVDLSQAGFLKAVGNFPSSPLLLPGAKQLVGIAPFARHKEKMYPLEKMKSFVRQLNERPGVSIVFFGGPGEEAKQLDAWQEEFDGSLNVAGKISIEEEMQLISNLSLMISMDSANMHMASVYGVPVVSIWGPTHPYAGFYGWGQDYENIVQADLYCRPCSVFGNKPCFRGDHACMHLVSTEMIMQKVTDVLAKTAH